MKRWCSQSLAGHGAAFVIVLLLAMAGLGACRGVAPDMLSATPAALPAMPTPRRALGVAVHLGQLYAAGGWNGESTQLSVVEIYDPAQNLWRTGSDLRTPRSQHSLVSTGDRLWIVGGWSATAGLVSAVDVLDDLADEWRTATHLPAPRREPGVALWENEIVVAGGFDGWNDADMDGYSARVDAYDPVRNRWRRLASLQQPRRGLSLVTVDKQLYAIGGYGPESPGFLNTVERYAATADRWEVVAWPISARTWAGAVTLPGVEGTDLLIAGGYNQTGFLDLVERIDPRTGRICHPPPLTVARAWFGAALAADTLLLLGGETTGGFTSSLTQETGECVP